jgi:hypothetical protein
MNSITLALSPNKAYLASCLWHPAQIQPIGWTSDTLKPLGESFINIKGGAYEKF